MTVSKTVFIGAVALFPAAILHGCGGDDKNGVDNANQGAARVGSGNGGAGGVTDKLKAVAEQGQVTAKQLQEQKEKLQKSVPDAAIIGQVKEAIKSKDYAKAWKVITEKCRPFANTFARKLGKTKKQLTDDDKEKCCDEVAALASSATPSAKKAQKVQTDLPEQQKLASSEGAVVKAHQQNLKESVETAQELASSAPALVKKGNVEDGDAELNGDEQFDVQKFVDAFKIIADLEKELIASGDAPEGLAFAKTLGDKKLEEIKEEHLQTVVKNMNEAERAFLESIAENKDEDNFTDEQQAAAGVILDALKTIAVQNFLAAFEMIAEVAPKELAFEKTLEGLNDEPTEEDIQTVVGKLDKEKVAFLKNLQANGTDEEKENATLILAALQTEDGDAEEEDGNVVDFDELDGVQKFTAAFDIIAELAPEELAFNELWDGLNFDEAKLEDVQTVAAKIDEAKVAFLQRVAKNDGDFTPEQQAAAGVILEALPEGSNGPEGGDVQDVENELSDAMDVDVDGASGSGAEPKNVQTRERVEDELDPEQFRKPTPPPPAPVADAPELSEQERAEALRMHVKMNSRGTLRHGTIATAPPVEHRAAPAA